MRAYKNRVTGEQSQSFLFRLSFRNTPKTHRWFHLLIKRPFSIWADFYCLMCFIAKLTVHFIFAWSWSVVVSNTRFSPEAFEGTINLRMDCMTGNNISWWQSVTCFIIKKQLLWSWDDGVIICQNIINLNVNATGCFCASDMHQLHINKILN